MGRRLNPASDWRRELRRGIGALLAIKLVALVVIKVLFFSGDMRVNPTLTGAPPERHQ